MKTILAIDQGTTGTKALIMNQNLEKIAEHTENFKQHYPQPGWVEHDPEEIWQTVLTSIKKILEKTDAHSIVAIGITNQRETLCFWDRDSGKPLCKAIVWQDRRTSVICEQMVQKGAEPFIQDNTGLVIDPYFSGTKAAWAIQNWEPVKKAQKAGTLAVGTIDSYLIARLSGGGTHVTEPSNASRTMCFHLHKHQWDSELCSMLSVPQEIWPEIRPSVGNFSKVRDVPGLVDGTPITGVLGDQQSALLGQACIQEGTAKCTYGTGAFLLLNTGSKPIKSRHRLLTTVAWALSEQDYTYALEGSAFIAGAAIQWVRDGLKLIQSASEIEDLAKSVDDSQGVVFVPSLTGLGAPHWDPYATGNLSGITRGTEPGHIARAVLEGVAFQNADILTAMQKDLGKPLSSLNVDGGACSNNLLMQFQADILGVELRRPEYTETTSLGAVFAAGLGVGLWSDLHEISQTWKMEKEFLPTMSNSERDQRLKQWDKAIARVRA